MFTNSPMLINITVALIWLGVNWLQLIYDINSLAMWRLLIITYEGFLSFFYIYNFVILIVLHFSFLYRFSIIYVVTPSLKIYRITFTQFKFTNSSSELYWTFSSNAIAVITAFDATFRFLPLCSVCLRFVLYHYYRTNNLSATNETLTIICNKSFLLYRPWIINRKNILV